MRVLHLGQIGIRSLLELVFNEVHFDSEEGLRAYNIEMLTI